MRNNVKYDADQRAQAKAEGRTLFTIDLDAAAERNRPRTRVTFQGLILSEDERTAVLALIRRLTAAKHPKGKKCAPR